VTVAVATHLVEVEFKGHRRAFFTWSGESAPAPRTPVIVPVERGEDFARVHTTGALAEQRKAGTTHGKASPETLPAILRLATAKEIDTAVRLRADEDAVRRAAIELVREMSLDMKISDTEWQWDRRRLTIYFTAEERVDFRDLVRKMERRFSTRVHMWHIGVRDEAKRLDGVGRCGRPFCSSTWLPQLNPVKSSAAKDQRLSTLNPGQISGTCGRLMCCLRYEHEFYVQQRKRFPKEGKLLTTAVGEEKVISNDIFRERVTLRNAAGEYRTIALALLRHELGEGPMPEPEPDVATEDEGEDHEEERLPVVPLARATPRARPPERTPERTPARPRNADRPERSARPATPAPPSTTPTPPDARDDARRPKRRRGRRGGRRGRGDGATGGDAPST
jgi:cell fate regulator YaaT (PSP1 superfamily)